MIRRPPRSTRTDTLFPYTTLFRSDHRPVLAGVDVLGKAARPVIVAFGDSITDNTGCAIDAVPICRWGDVLGRRLARAGKPHVVVTQAISGNRVISSGTGPSAVERFDRSEESRVGKKCVSTCRSRWSPYQ